MRQIRIFFDALAALCGLCLLTLLALVAPAAAGLRPAVVLTGSMEPAYPVGGVLYYRPVQQEEIAVRDVLVFRAADGTLISHRVERINADGTYTVRGDRLPQADPTPIAFSSVEGRACALCLPYAGYFLRFILQDWVLSVMLFVLALKAILLLCERRGRHGCDNISALRDPVASERMGKP